MELSYPVRTLSPSFCGFSNVPKRPSLVHVTAVSSKLHAVKRMRAVASSGCVICGEELLEMEEWSEMLKWGDKCRGSSNGVVELLECLEKEAIMGDDEGREAVDYNRRAMIFDKSGRVFQALKHQGEEDDDENAENHREDNADNQD